LSYLRRSGKQAHFFALLQGRSVAEKEIGKESVVNRLRRVSFEVKLEDSCGNQGELVSTLLYRSCCSVEKGVREKKLHQVQRKSPEVAGD
jgi:hypothetical protein